MMTYRKPAFFLWLFLISILTLLTSLRIDSGDGIEMYKVADSLLSGQGGAISVIPLTSDPVGAWGKVESLESYNGGDGYGKWGRDGNYYAKYGPGWSLVIAPFLALAKFTSSFFPTVTAEFAGKAMMVWLNALVTATSGVLLFALLAQFYSSVISVTLAIVYCLGTYALYYSRSGFSEPLVTILLLLALYANSHQKYTVSGIALGGMLFTRQTSAFLVIPLGMFVVVSIWRNNRKTAFPKFLSFVVPVAIGQFMMLGYNFYRFGNWMESGYGVVQWDTPLLLGLYSQILSPGKGLLILAPILVTGVLGFPFFFQKNRLWAVMTVILAIVWLIPHSLYRDWTGGGGWGPRLLLPIVPLFFFWAGEIFVRWNRVFIGRLALAGLVVISMYFQLLGTTANWARPLQQLYDSSTSPVEFFQRGNYDWAYSPLIGQLRTIKEESAYFTNATFRDSVNLLVRQKLLSDSPDRQTEALSLLSLNVPDYWFFYLYFLGILPLWEVIVMVASLVGLMFWSLRCLRQSLLADVTRTLPSNIPVLQVE